MEELVTCEGAVHSVIFQNAENGYTVLRLLTEEGEVITVVGCIPCVAPGEHLAVSGVWEQHPQHGEQLRAVELERTLPEDEEDLLDGMDIWTDNQPETWYYLVVQEATNSHNFERKDDGVHECWTVLKEDPDWAQYEN